MYGIRLYLFGYEGATYSYKHLKMWWLTSVLKKDLDASLELARTYCYQLMKKGDITSFNIVVGETDA